MTRVVPFVTLRPSCAWLVLLAVAPLLYRPLEDGQTHGVWAQPGWSWPVDALPFFVVRGFEIAHRWRVAGEAIP